LKISQKPGLTQIANATITGGIAASVATDGGDALFEVIVAISLRR